MSTEKKVNDLTLIIPADEDPADMPTIFKEFVDGMPEEGGYLLIDNNVEDAVIHIRPDEPDSILEFNNTTGGDPVKKYLSASSEGPSGETYEKGFWYDNKYGFEFLVIAGENDEIELVSDEPGVSFVPTNTIAANSVVSVTRISPTLWLAAGAQSPEGPFIFAQSLMGSEDYYAESK